MSTQTSSTRLLPLADLFAEVEGDSANVLGGEGGGDFSSAPSPPGRLHIVRSVGRNPYANLAVEQRLLERAHPDSRVLFLYCNSPCVVIGRNQNPWQEVALADVRVGRQDPGEGGEPKADPGEPRDPGPPVLVRRRSGGGAVYHDAGNTNWSVLVPSAGFDRDQHAHMVARALRRLGVATAQVNARHDIVVDAEAEHLENSSAEGAADEDPGTRKVSGSAYKLTRGRALHHGTCLLGADLEAVSGLLRSPAAPFLNARGVASVRSPVQNVLRDEAMASSHARFADAVAAEFAELYGGGGEQSSRMAVQECVVDPDAEAAATAGFDFDPKLAKGYEELLTPDWIFGQTPQFQFSTRPTEDDPEPRPARPISVPVTFHLAFTARHGRLQDVAVSGLPGPSYGNFKDINAAVVEALHGQLLYQIDDWTAVLKKAGGSILGPIQANAIGNWLNGLFGVGKA